MHQLRHTASLQQGFNSLDLDQRGQHLSRCWLCEDTCLYSTSLINKEPFDISTEVFMTTCDASGSWPHFNPLFDPTCRNLAAWSRANLIHHQSSLLHRPSSLASQWIQTEMGAVQFRGCRVAKHKKVPAQHALGSSRSRGQLQNL